ncbi:MAG: hypothetical protein QXE82_04355 [Candidatus Nitrosotenuis sp.]
MVRDWIKLAPSLILRFGLYLDEKINERQKEISQLIEAGNEVRETVYCLKPVAMKYRNKYRVFEPKHRRRISSFKFHE